MAYFAMLLFGLLPRLLVFFFKVLSDWFDSVFYGWLWIILGVLFAPCTLFWYSVVINWFYGVWGTWQIVILVLAIIFDLFSISRIRNFNE